MQRRAIPARPIIVVEDDESLRRAFERLLQAAGHQVSTFASAEALLESEVRSDAGCLILDVRLPGISGFELRERLALEGLSPPVIYVTAHDDDKARGRAESEGAPFFLKPVYGKQLLAAVAQALARL